MMKTFLLAVLAALLPISLIAQNTSEETYDPKTEKVYHVNPWVSGGIGVGGMLISTVGIDRLRDKDDFTLDELNALNRDDIPGFDRYGLNRDPEQRESSEETSDLIFNASILLPLTLFVDKKFRKDWLDITTMYIEAHALSGNTYAWSPLGPTFNNRIRPVAYYPEVDFGLRSQGNSRNSFFSGHVSTTATGTFFFTKVLSDYNPQWTGGQRALAFGLASVPPIFAGVMRVRALKHFPSDSLAGLAVGAFFGIMTPQVHKNWQRKHRSKISIGGSYGDGMGSGGLVLTF